MKKIEIDDDLYAFIAAQTKHIGESASDILRRLLLPKTAAPVKEAASPKAPAPSTPAKSGQRASASTENAPRPVKAKGADSVLHALTADALNEFSKRVEQFLFVLSQIHKANPSAFAAVEQIKGKNRTYFATSKDDLLKNGSSTNPKAIPDSPYWVVTNNNTAKKVAMLEQVLLVLNYDKAVIQQIIQRFAPELA